MINAIGETAEYRRQRWNNATGFEREKYNKEMEQWKKNYPFAHAVMMGEPVTQEMINNILKK